MSPDSDRLRWKALALSCVANFTVILDAQIVILGLLYAQQVLGFSALEFGLGTVVMTVGTVIGSMLGQALVTRVGPGAVASAGLALTGLGLLVLTQVSVGGSYFGDIFVGILIFGPGLGATFVAASVATLAGVPERESGLASGLNTASFQIGGAFGSAVVTSVAVSAAAGSGDPLTLTEGHQSAFAAAIAFPVLGVVFLTLLTRLKPSPKSTPARSSPVMPSRGWDPVRRRY
jgi:MFS family permease